MNTQDIEAIYTAAWSIGVPPGTYQFEFIRHRSGASSERIARALRIPEHHAQEIYDALAVIFDRSGYCTLDFTLGCDVCLSRTASPYVVHVDLIVKEAA